jgi:hypothetical protein
MSWKIPSLPSKTFPPVSPLFGTLSRVPILQGRHQEGVGLGRVGEDRDGVNTCTLWTGWGILL